MGFAISSNSVNFDSSVINFTNASALTLNPGTGIDSLTVNSGTVNIAEPNTRRWNFYAEFFESDRRRRRGGIVLNRSIAFGSNAGGNHIFVSIGTTRSRWQRHDHP